MARSSPVSWAAATSPLNVVAPGFLNTAMTEVLPKRPTTWRPGWSFRGGRRVARVIRWLTPMRLATALVLSSPVDGGLGMGH